MNFVSLPKFFRFLDQLGLGEIVIWILKQLPMTPQCPMYLCTRESQNLTRWKSKIVLSTGELQNLTRWKSKIVLSTGESQLPGVLGTGESFFISLNLQAHAAAFKATFVQKAV